MIVRLAALAAMLSQLSAAASPPADPAQVARSRAEGDAVIAKAGVADLFENVTAGAPIRLRHKPSGYVCGFDPGKPGKEIQLSRASRGATTWSAARGLGSHSWTPSSPGLPSPSRCNKPWADTPPP